MTCQPSSRELVEQAADVLLAGGAAVVALHQRQHVARDDEHRDQQGKLGADEQRAVQAEGLPEDGREHGQDAKRHKRAQAQPQERRARVLAG